MVVQLPSDFREFLSLLNQARIEYLVVGGYAVGYHGHARATKDIDIWESDARGNVQRLVEVLREFGFDAPVLAQWVADSQKTLRMGYPPVRIEVLTQVSGVQFSEAYPARIRAELDGIPVNIISLQHLKANKQAAGRHQDLADLENLP